LITDDTQPSYAIRDENALLPPPKILFYGVLGLSFLSVILPIVSIFLFRDVLRPSQQQRIINNLPVMSNFLPYRPAAEDTVPTVVNTGTNLSADLLIEATQTPTFSPTITMIPPTLTNRQEALSTSGSAEIDKGEKISPTSTVIPTVHVIETIATSTVMPTVTNDRLAPIESSLVPLSARLYGFTFEQQTWNNCGPASVTIALSYFGWQENQEYARKILRPDREDKNVTPDEMVSFVNENTGIRALWRYGGTIDLVRDLIANEFPVIFGTGFMPEAYDWIGHYRTAVAYDSAYFYFYDSFMGAGSDNQGYALSIDEVDQNWQQFNRRFIVLYSPDREQQLLKILDERSTINGANEIALDTAKQEARINPQNAYAWFNMGTTLTHLNRFEEASVAFDRARQARLPWRMLWYQFEPYRAYYETGRYDDVLALVQSNLNNGGKYVEETFYWQGVVYEAQDQIDQARSAYQQALQLNPNFTQASEAINKINSID